MQAAPGRLVDKCDYVTSPGKKVRSLVTDLAVLERVDGAPGTWRVALLVPSEQRQPEETLALLRQRCPWPLELPTPLPVAPPPTATELRLLGELDPDGRGRTRAGAAATNA
jgi:hypothetical protein